MSCGIVGAHKHQRLKRLRRSGKTWRQSPMELAVPVKPKVKREHWKPLALSNFLRRSSGGPR